MFAVAEPLVVPHWIAMVDMEIFMAGETVTETDAVSAQLPDETMTEYVPEEFTVMAAVVAVVFHE
jgi:hypothetical protein